MLVRSAIILLAISLIIPAGCLQKPSETGAPQGSVSRPQAGNNRPAMPSPESDDGDPSGRRDGSIFVASSGGGGAGVSSSGGAPAPMPPTSPTAPGVGSGSLANGLFPQIGSTASGVAASGGSQFGGGLFPHVGSTESAGISLPNPFDAFGGASRNEGRDLSPTNVNEKGNENTTATGATYLERAKEAYKDGNEALATSLLYAYYLSDESGSGEFQLAWFDGFSSPRLFSRFGVGVTYSPYRGFQDAPPTIGEPYVAPSRSSSNPEDLLGSANQGGGLSGPGGRDASKSPYANVDTSSPAGALLYYTGDFGERLYKRLNDRRKQKSMFGAILAGMPEPVQKNTTPTTTASTSAPAAPVGGPPPRDNPFVLGNMGGGTPPPVPGGGGAPASGTNDPVSAPGGAGTLVAKWSLTAPSGPPAHDLSGTLLLSRSKEHGIDLLLIFDVSVPQPPRNGTPYALISLRLVDVTDPDNPRNLQNTAQLNSQKVGETRSTQQNDRNDPVELELDKIFQRTVDVSFVATQYPEAINEDNVSRQVERLTEEKTRNPWLSAVEIIGYVRKGLLRESDAQDAIEKILGGEARVLVAGTVRERKNYLENVLLQSVASKPSSSDSDFR